MTNMWSRDFLFLGLAVGIVSSASAVPNASSANAFVRDDDILRMSVPVVDGRPHHLYVGRCGPRERLLHEEIVVVNNAGGSRIAGTIQMNLDANVAIGCVKVLDQAGVMSGAYPNYVAGGVGHNYIVLSFRAAHDYGLNFYVQLYGRTILN